MKSSNKIALIGLSLIVLINWIQNFFANTTDEQLPMLLFLLQPILITIFVFWHGYYRYGWRNMIVFFLLVFAISWSLESLSIYTSFPFGWYNYSDLMGAKLGVVPIMIMPSYFGYGYLSWIMGNVITDSYGKSTKRQNVWVVPFLAAFIMSAWDLCGDIIWSTIQGTWTWTYGGSFYGVPIQNYLGWYLVVFLCFITFSFYIKSAKINQEYSIEKSNWFWILPPLMYLTTLFQPLASFLYKENYQVASLDNHIWWTNDIYGTSLLVGLWTMLPFVLFSFYKIRKHFAGKK